MRVKAVIALLLLLGLMIGDLYMRGFRLRVGKDKLRDSHRTTVPVATVRLLDPLTGKSLKTTDIWAFNEIYLALGVTSEGFAKWEHVNGYSSLGKDQSGHFLIRGFPVFSKVAWMYIDPVDLSVQEVKQLVRECTAAEDSSNDAVAKKEFSRIRTLAQEAVSMSASLRFDHP